MAQQGLDLGRLSEPASFILVSLAEGPKHGYAIMGDVQRISGEPMSAGTLYQVLARLEQRGLIEALEPVERRRPYRLTGDGTAAIDAHLKGLARLVATGRQRLGGRPA